ncbi:hypothetical protein CAAN3_26S00826 [[Candida] anglica]
MKQSSRYLLVYAAASILVALWAVYDSLDKAVDYFTLAVELTQNYKLGILLNLVLLVFIGVGQASIIGLFGALRILEIEHVVEKLPMFMVNLLFNLTITDSNLILNCLLLGLAVISKIHHVILVDRFDFIHVRLLNNAENDSALTRGDIISQYCKCWYFWYIPMFIIGGFTTAKFLVYDVFKGVNSVICLLFGFQFAVQEVELLTYFGKVLLNMYEIIVYREVDDEEEEEEEEVEVEVEVEVEEEGIEIGAGGVTESDNGADDEDDGNEIDFDDDDDNEIVWENKAYYIKAIDIASAVLKAVSHLGFIYLLMVTSNLSLPISMLSGTYSSLVQIYKEFSQLLLFIESSKKLDTLLPNATSVDLESGDNLCSICREDMHAVDEGSETSHKQVSARKFPKKLPCGHIIHMGCLKEWLERSEFCPLCRRKVFVSAADISREHENELVQAAQQELRASISAETGTETGVDAREIERNNAINVQEDDLTRIEVISIDPTPSSSTSTQPTSSSTFTQTQTNDAYQTIHLPKNALLPPDWTLLPITKKDDDSYLVDITKDSQATLRVVSEAERSNIQLHTVVPRGNGREDTSANDIVKELTKANKIMRERIQEMESVLEAFRNER